MPKSIYREPVVGFKLAIWNATRPNFNVVVVGGVISQAFPKTNRKYSRFPKKRISRKTPVPETFSLLPGGPAQTTKRKRPNTCVS